MGVLRDVALIVAGVALIFAVIDSAIRTFVLPRGVVVPLTRFVMVMVRRLFDLRLRFAKSYEARDRVMAMYGPLALFALVAVWLVLVLAGFTLIFWAIQGDGPRRAFVESGSSVFTLGFERPLGAWADVVAFAAAAVGLAVLALLIAYLPSIYGSFSRREVLVAHVSARAGTPPRAVDLLRRAHLIGQLHDLDEIWVAYQTWFAETEETHTSIPLLAFFRSPDPDRSWITASGAVLDAAAFVNSAIDLPRQPMAALCVRSGFSCLRSVADYFGIPYPHDPQQGDPVSIAREEFDVACRELEAAGVPLVSDRDQAWLDFAGWRVNYDAVLITLAGLIVAPYAPWSSDRSIPFSPRAVRLRRRTGS
jgi:hypothetical protein